MANTIEYAKVFNTELDKQMVPLLCTGWMEANAGQVQYNGGDEAKIPSINMDGLGSYDRENGYPTGSVSLAYQTVKLTQDRAQGFNFDAMTVNESNFLVMAGNVMGEFQRTKVAPEVDAYRLSTINELAGTDHIHEYAPAAASLLKELQNDIAVIQDKIGDSEPLVIHMSIPVATIMSQTDSIAKKLDVTDFKAGEITTKVKSLDGIPILRTPSARMKSAYVFKTGADGEFGFAPATDAVDINWIILHRSAPLAVCKTDVSRVFDPSTYQKANAWHVDYRKFHDLWIKTNKLDGVLVNRKAAPAPAEPDSGV